MKEIYDWVPWFRELARKIAGEDKRYLFEKAKQVKWGEDSSLLQHGDKGIDPFSFFSFLASKSTTNQQELVYNSVSREFEIKIPLPDMHIEDYYLFPSSGYEIFFHDRTNFYSDLLWRLFREAIKDNPNIDLDFKRALDIKEIGVAKLTQTLFLINPRYFPPVDSSIGVLSKALDLPAPLKIKNEIKDGGYEKYLSVRKKIKKAFPGCQPYEINMFLFLQKAKKIINAESKFFQITIIDRSDYWDDFKKNNWVYTKRSGLREALWVEWKHHLTKPKRGDIILVRMGEQTGRAIGIVQRNDYDESGLNENSGIHVLWINKSEAKLFEFTDRGGFNEAGPETCSDFEETKSYKPSFDLINSLTGNFSENDDDSQQEADTMQYPLNQILYGPPGTGKTWNTVNHAVAIIEDKPLDELEDDKDARQRFRELKRDGQIAMVTFHQNFTYEDFIEGIRPVLDDEDENIEYKLSEGVFRKIADRANKNRAQSEQTDDESWDMDELLQAFAESIEERLESGEDINLFPADHRSGATIGEINWSRDGKFQSFKLGGTIKYQRLTKNVIKRDYEAFYQEKIKSAQDIKPTYKSKRTEHGNALYYFALYEKIKQFHDEEWQSEESVPVNKQNYVLIIDEINRGNIAKIFAELITLIEPSKRIGSKKDETTVTLPYSKEEFGVPDNLYIIGTMNTADRSIAPLDTALRRRFEFVEMMPKPYHASIRKDIETDIEGVNVNCQELLAAMNQRIHFLLDREHQIGHTYFMDVDDMESLAATFKNQIIPLLQEYFYDNWEKIDLVLNCNGFIDPQPPSIDSNLFKNSELIDEKRKIYELLPGDDDKWKDPKSYQTIYEETGEGDNDGSEQDT